MFKNSIAALVAAVLLVACAPQTEEKTTTEETTTTTENPNQLGETFSEEGAISMAELAQQMEGKDSTDVKVVAEIVESCQNKGCWMDVKMADGTPMKVSFDYKFLLPTKEMKGQEVVFIGTAKRDTMSVEDQRHFAEDAGKSKEEINAITEPKPTISFLARGVILKENQPEAQN